MLTTALTVVGADRVWAQEGDVPRAAIDTRLQLKRTVTVVTTGGEVVNGKLAELSPASLALLVDGRLRTIPVDDVKQVRQRQADSLVNGALIGAASGAVYALTWYVRDPNECGGVPCGQEILASAGLGALIGLGVDALFKKTVTVENPGAGQKRSVSLTTAPQPRGASMSVAVRW
jgi:hypothetical protein